MLLCSSPEGTFDRKKFQAAPARLGVGKATLAIYGLCCVESLLSCAALDKLRPQAYRHDPNQELVGQGLANLTSGAFGGLPVSAVIARSTLNVTERQRAWTPESVRQCGERRKGIGRRKTTSTRLKR